MTDDFVDDPQDGGARGPDRGLDKGPDAFRTISEVAEELGLPQHVLRFWETRFPQIKPIKRGGGRRYYRPGDVELLRGVKELLYGQGYTIRGVQRILREQGGRKLAQAAGASPAADPASEARPEPDFYAPRREPVRAPELDVRPQPPLRGDLNVRPEPQFRQDAPDGAREADLFHASPVVETEDIRGRSEPVLKTEPEPVRPSLSERQAKDLAAALGELKACRRLLDGWS